MADLFREIDESLKQERLQHIWRKYQYVAYGLVVVIVAIVIGYKTWQYFEDQTIQQRAILFHQLQENISADNKDEAYKTLQTLMQQRIDGTAMVGVLMSVDILHDTHYQEILSLLQQLESAKQDDEIYSPIFVLARHGLMLRHTQSADNLASMSTELTKLTAGDNALYRAVARQYLAEIALQQGDKQRAADLMQQIVEDTGATSSLQAASSIIEQMLTYELTQN